MAVNINLETGKDRKLGVWLDRVQSWSSWIISDKFLNPLPPESSHMKRGHNNHNYFSFLVRIKRDSSWEGLNRRFDIQ